MYLEQLNSVDPKVMPFKDIIETYNNNFELLKKFLLTLGDEYTIENFVNSTDTIITLDNSYKPSKNNLFLYINGVLQLLDKDYKELSSNSIELLSDRDYDDEIKVVIIKSNLLQVSVEEYVNELSELVATAKASLDSASSIMNESVLVRDTIKTYYEDANNIYNSSLELLDELKSIDAENESNLVKYGSLLQQMKDIEGAIANMSVLTPEQIEGTEVVLARGKFATLDNRLDKMIYQFDTVEEMQLCYALTSGDRCLTFGKSEIGDDSTKIYKIAKDSEIPPDVDEIYLLGNGLKAYLMTIFSGIGGGSGGSGSGGVGSTGSITLTPVGETSLAIAKGSSLYLNYLFENNLGSTGTAVYHINDIPKVTKTISKGKVEFDIGPYLTEGLNVVDIIVTDRYGSRAILSYNIEAVMLEISSTFNDTISYDGSIIFKFTPYGNVLKTVNFIIDGKSSGTLDVTTSGQQYSTIFPAMSHGVHRLEVFMTAQVGIANLKSNSLVYDIMCIEQGNTTPMIASVLNISEIVQGKQITIPYSVYDPTKLACDISLEIYTMEAGGIVSYYSNDLTVDRSRQEWITRNYPTGEVYFSIKYGSIQKTHTVSVLGNGLDGISAKTNDLELYLSSANRSNDEQTDRDKWSDNEFHTSFHQLNWKSNGWVKDNNGDTCLRLNGGATAQIGFKPFNSDLKVYGKTIEIEFAIRDVNSRDDILIECFNNDIGIQITADTATFKSSQSTISCRYRDEEKIRLAFVVESNIQDRLMSIYINGVLSVSKQYPDNDDFQQTSPVDISLGSPTCSVDIYTIRSYSTALTSNEVTLNYIADTADLAKQMELSYDNDIYDDYGNISYISMKERIPVMTIIGTLPKSKGDKQNVIVKYENYLNAGLNFEDSCVIDVQGTSSQWYVVKNYKLEFISRHQHDNEQLSTSVFCMKADYAEATGTHNTQNANLVHTLYSSLTPAQETEPRSRTTIFGYPCVIFHQSDEADDPKFVGKYNFNFDKGSLNIFGFTNSFDVESWEFCNNTSDACNFLGEIPENWSEDFEARYPEKSKNIERFKIMHSWVVSTRRDTATNKALQYPEVLGDNTYLVDNADYRLAKFKYEFENHFDLHFSLIYYVYTFFMLMTDQRAKNMFLTYWGSTGKWQPWFYDNDTCLGINNEGQLIFDYYHEDTDTLHGANVYNGQNSVLWNNFRLAFPEEIKSTYQNLRNSGLLTYDILVDYFLTNGSDKWSASIYNEDSEYKYISMLRTSGDASNLPQIRGSGEEHFKYFVENRINYCDSKWYASDYADDYVSLRIYTPKEEQVITPNADISVIPYSAMYAGVRYKANGNLLSERAEPGKLITFEAPNETFNDTETAIYGASQLSSLGDLAPLYCGSINVAKASKLTELKIGDSTEGYSNPNLNSLSIGTNKLLKILDIRNCPNLTDPLDLSGCPNIEEVYAAGSSISGISLADSGYLRVLQLPGTLDTLNLINQLYINLLDIEDYSSIRTLRIENCPGIDLIQLLSDCTNLKRARFLGINWSFDNADYLLSPSLYSIKGLDENGINTDIISLVGKCHITLISGEELGQIKELYPYLDISYDSLTSEIIFMSEDGSSEYGRMEVRNGSDGTDPIAAKLFSTPQKESTEQYIFYFNGWSLTPGGDSSDDALKSVTIDRYVYAAFTTELQKYRVRFYTGTTILQILEDVEYGSNAIYTGPTPYKTNVPNMDDYEFIGWNPDPSNITEDTYCYAQFTFVGYIEDDWDTIMASIEDGTYKDKYCIGSRKLLNYTYSDGVTESISMEIADFDHDTLSSGVGKAAITFVARNLLRDNYNMNDSKKTYGGSSSYNEGGWYLSDMRNYCNNTVFSFLPINIQSSVEAVVKHSDLGEHNEYDTTTNDTIWLLSNPEVGFTNDIVGSQGYLYPIFTNNESRARSKVGSASESWWLRTTTSKATLWDFHFHEVNFNGSRSYAHPTSELGVCPCFCIGKSPYIHDTWDQLIAAIDDGTYSSRYSVGKMISLDLGDEGILYMQVAAIDSDELSDGSGTAPITFISRGLLLTPKSINPRLTIDEETSTSVGGAIGGWSQSQLRAYLYDTILNLLPESISNRLAEVKKTSLTYESDTSKGTVTSNETLWIPSYREIFGSNIELSGPSYSELFEKDTWRIKANPNGEASSWWLRTASNSDSATFYSVDSTGLVTIDNDSSDELGICLGFCLK